MATTAIGIPYPIGTDNNDTATSFLNLVNWLNAVLNGSYTSAAIAAFTATEKWTSRRVWNSTRGVYQWYDGAAWNDEAGVLIANKTVSYTLVATDANGIMFQMNAAGALNFLLPTNAAVALPIGTVINGYQYGAGQVTIAAVTPGTTNVRATPGAKTRAQYSSFSAVKIAADEWILSGDLVP